ncbi:MAG: hypothetical protein O9972_14835 [Burkholderiales bacterium]|nr:hypothetical protein [Burkholderiales bacterium]
MRALADRPGVPGRRGCSASHGFGRCGLRIPGRRRAIGAWDRFPGCVEATFGCSRARGRPRRPVDALAKGD